MKNKITNFLKIAFVTGSFLGFVLVAGATGTWSSPAGAPPDGNVDAPINVGSTSQIKTGPLSISNLFAVGSSSGLVCYFVPTTSGCSTSARGDSTTDSFHVAGNSSFDGTSNFLGLTNLDDIVVAGNTHLVNTFISGQTHLSGSFNTIDNNLTVNGPAIVYGGVKALSEIVGDTSSTPAYTLDLRGSTNIGSGATCNLISSSDATTGCPLGSYLYAQNIPDGVYGKCRYFSTDVSGSLGNCYTPPSLVFTHASPYQIYGGSTPVGSCGEVNYNLTAPVSGGVPPYHYSWTGAASSTAPGVSVIGGGVDTTTTYDSISVTVTDSNPIPVSVSATRSLTMPR